MSAEGLRVAALFAREYPTSAATLAAELRNAVTPASLVADCTVGVIAEDVRATVAHVLAIADALHPGGRMRAPERDSSGGHKL